MFQPLVVSFHDPPVTCDAGIKSFFPLRDTRVMDESSIFSSSVCFVGWAVDAQHIERRITLLSWYQIDLKRAWLRTVRSTPLIRSEGSSETTLIKQENLDNGAWLWSGCKTDESGVFTGPGRSYKPFTGQRAATLQALLPLSPSTGTLLKTDDIW